MPPVTRTDFPYPLRTVDGEVDVVVDSLLATNLDVTGQTNVNDLYVSGTTTIVGGIVDLANIDCLTLNVQGAAQVGGLSSLNGGVNTTSIQCTNITSSGLLNGTNVTLSSLTPNQTVATNATKQLISVPSTGTGNNVLQNNPTINNLTLTGPLAASSLTLTTPLATSSGGTGTTSSTGTGSNVLQTNPTLVTPNIGAATGTSLNVSGNIVTTGGAVGAQVYVANSTVGVGLNVLSTDDSTSPTTGSIQTSGGIGVAKNIVAGGVIQSNINQNATSTSTGALRAINGGMSCAQNLVVGGSATISGNASITGNVSAANFSGGGIINPANVFNITNTTNATSGSTGSIQTNGGLGVVKDIWADGNVHANQLFINTLILNSVTMDFSSGTFNPTFTTTVGTDVLPPVSYISRTGYYQNVNKMTFLHVQVTGFLTSLPVGEIAMSVGNIPQVYRNQRIPWGTDQGNWDYKTVPNFQRISGTQLFTINTSDTSKFAATTQIIQNVGGTNTGFTDIIYPATTDVLTVQFAAALYRTSP